MHPIHVVYAAIGGWCVYKVGTFARRSVVTTIIPFHNNPEVAIAVMRVVVALASVLAAVLFVITSPRA